MPLIYVIILTWNQYHHTKSCLTSLQKTTYPNLQIVVVDNNSTDGTPEKVNQDFPTATLLTNDENLGFAAGNNIGIRYALENDAAYIFILNNDTLVASSLFERLLAAISQRPDGTVHSSVGMIAPLIYYADEPQRIWSSGGKRHFVTYEKTGDLAGQIDRGQYAKPVSQDYFTGCAMLLSCRLLKSVGLFDERFFFTYEDSDLCVRARDAGYQLLLAPDAHIWHKVSVSTGGSGSPTERYWMARSSILFFAKHIRGWRWLFVIPFRLGSAILISIRLVSQSKFSSLGPYWRGLHDGIRQL